MVGMRYCAANLTSLRRSPLNSGSAPTSKASKPFALALSNAASNSPSELACTLKIRSPSARPVLWRARQSFSALGLAGFLSTPNPGLGHKLLQQLQPLWIEGGREGGASSEVAAGSAEALDQAELDGFGSRSEDDRDRRRGCLCCRLARA